MGKNMIGKMVELKSEDYLDAGIIKNNPDLHDRFDGIILKCDEDKNYLIIKLVNKISINGKLYHKIVVYPRYLGEKVNNILKEEIIVNQYFVDENVNNIEQENLRKLPDKEYEFFVGEIRLKKEKDDKL